MEGEEAGEGVGGEEEAILRAGRSDDADSRHVK